MRTLAHEDPDEEALLSREEELRVKGWWRPGIILAACMLVTLVLLLRRPGPSVLSFAGFEEKESIGNSVPEYDTSWADLLSGSSCEPLELPGGTITCSLKEGRRFFQFPVGKFAIDRQVVVPANTAIKGYSNPIDPSDKSKAPDPITQTYFVATKGISDPQAAYCGTNGNLKQGDAQNLRIGFLLNSNTSVQNINFQGRDTTRPYDNGNLCGGGVFETPGCVSPGFGDGVGTGWVNKRTGCYDHTGKPNDLITGNGKGVENIVIENVRLNDLFLPSDPSKYDQGQGSQVAVWLAMTQDGSATKNVHITNLVSMLTRGDGINFHGNVQHSIAENCHVENTGDDIYAFWGAYAENPSQNVFRNNVGKNPGVTRNYGYGVCVAVYGAMDLTISGTKCYDRGPEWNSGQVPHGDAACQNGAYCNSCLAYVHDGWFGAVYPQGNSIHLDNNEYFYMAEPDKSIPPSDRPKIRSDANSNANILTT
mmetsp:Transcript_103495/g.183855  ORF Transcript_103495/g.183855 Transcript_103495/m.183855 type:complete len:479 (+) Transcript_103495:28-1464(+)